MNGLIILSNITNPSVKGPIFSGKISRWMISGAWGIGYFVLKHRFRRGIWKFSSNNLSGLNFNLDNVLGFAMNAVSLLQNEAKES